MPSYLGIGAQARLAGKQFRADARQRRRAGKSSVPLAGRPPIIPVPLAGRPPIIPMLLVGRWQMMRLPAGTAPAVVAVLVALGEGLPVLLFEELLVTVFLAVAVAGVLVLVALFRPELLAFGRILFSGQPAVPIADRTGHTAMASVAFIGPAVIVVVQAAGAVGETVATTGLVEVAKSFVF